MPRTPLMYQELSEAYRIVDEDEETRVLVITGAGRAFSAGADVSETLYKERIQKREEQGVPDVIRSVGFSLAGKGKIPDSAYSASPRTLLSGRVGGEIFINSAISFVLQ